MLVTPLAMRPMSHMPNTEPVLAASGSSQSNKEGEVPQKSNSKGSSKDSYLPVHGEFFHQGKLPGRWLPVSSFLELPSEFPLPFRVIQSLHQRGHGWSSYHSCTWSVSWGHSQPHQ